MAMNTYMTFLMHSTDGSTYSDIVPIKDYPDFMNEVNTIDVTNLQNSMHTYIMGLLDTGGDMPFTCNYTAEDYQRHFDMGIDTLLTNRMDLAAAYKKAKTPV